MDDEVSAQKNSQVSLAPLGGLFDYGEWERAVVRKIANEVLSKVHLPASGVALGRWIMLRPIRDTVYEVGLLWTDA